MAKNKYPSLSPKLDEVAKYFIWKSNQEDRGISNLKLQKLCYYAQAWNLVFNKKPLFKDPIEAWIHGPAIHSLWKKYSEFGFNRITVDIPDPSKFTSLSDKDKKALDDVWDVYGGFDAKYLERLTHYERPWQDAREGVEFNEISNSRITPESMTKFYTEFYSEVETEEADNKA